MRQNGGSSSNAPPALGKYRPDRLLRHGLSLLCLLLFFLHAGHYLSWSPLHSLDHYFYDLRIRLANDKVPDERIVIVAIDERSLQTLGRWPWPRDTLAHLIDRLFDQYGIGALGLDVVFSEAEEPSARRLLETLAASRLGNHPEFRQLLPELQAQHDQDARLAAALRGRPIALGYYFSAPADAPRIGLLPAPVLPEGALANAPAAIEQRFGYGANLPVLQRAAASGGHFLGLVDDDGILRRAPTLIEFAGAYYESLSLAVLRLVLGSPQPEVRWISNDGAAASINLPLGNDTLRIPVDAHLNALIPYPGMARPFTYLSAADVFSGQVDANLLRGRIVLLGATAPGLSDLRATPVSGIYPGVEVHANLIAGMLDGQLPKNPVYSVAYDELQTLLAGVLLMLLLPALSPIRAAFLLAGLLLTMSAVNFTLWSKFHLALPLAGALLCSVLIFLIQMALAYLHETRLRRQIKNLFGQYVPPELVEIMASSPETYLTQSRNAELTVLFADIRDFTRISEGMTPEALAAMMNHYLGVMTEVIQQHQGTLDKYIGDAIMAFWGAPVDQAKHAQSSVAAALAMQASLNAQATLFEARGWPRLAIGIGINTGMMTVGDMGSRVRRAYTVMGDAVNTAARLESLTRIYGVPILVGEATRNAVPEICFMEVDRIRVKGRAAPLSIFMPLGPSADLPASTEKQLAAWRDFLAAYRRQDWPNADTLLEQHAMLDKDTPLHALYRTRLAALKATPPGDNWDGITNYSIK